MVKNYIVTRAHAVSDELGGTVGPQPGDQRKNSYHTVGELNFRGVGTQHYAVIRAKDKEVRKKIAECAVKCVRNAKVGYSQNNRYDLYDAVASHGFDPDSLKVAADCDCTTMCTVCANYAGIPILRSTYSGNMLERYKATKRFKILTSKKYAGKSEKLKVGDILLSTGHAAIVVNTLCHMVVNHHAGDNGEDVVAIQMALNEYGAGLKTDGVFGPLTYRAVYDFQRMNNLEVDGIVGEQTATALGILWR